MTGVQTCALPILNFKVFADFFQVITYSHLIKSRPGGCASFREYFGLGKPIGKVDCGGGDRSQYFVAVSIIAPDGIIQFVEVFIPIAKSKVEKAVFDYDAFFE